MIKYTRYETRRNSYFCKLIANFFWKMMIKNYLPTKCMEANGNRIHSNRNHQNVKRGASLNSFSSRIHKHMKIFDTWITQNTRISTRYQAAKVLTEEHNTKTIFTAAGRFKSKVFFPPKIKSNVKQNAGNCWPVECSRVNISDRYIHRRCYQIFVLQVSRGLPPIVCFRRDFGEWRCIGELSILNPLDY